MNLNFKKEDLIFQKEVKDFINDNLMSIDHFIENKYIRKNKKQPKKSKLEAQYNNYKYETIIIITSSNLLVYLQLELNDFLYAALILFK